MTPTKDDRSPYKSRLLGSLIVYGIVNCVLVMVLHLRAGSSNGAFISQTFLAYYGPFLAILSILASRFIANQRPLLRFITTGFSFILILASWMNLVVLIAIGKAMSKK